MVGEGETINMRGGEMARRWCGRDGVEEMVRRRWGGGDGEEEMVWKNWSSSAAGGGRAVPTVPAVRRSYLAG